MTRTRRTSADHVCVRWRRWSFYLGASAVARLPRLPPSGRAVFSLCDRIKRRNDDEAEDESITQIRATRWPRVCPTTRMRSKRAGDNGGKLQERRGSTSTASTPRRRSTTCASSRIRPPRVWVRVAEPHRRAARRREFGLLRAVRGAGCCTARPPSCPRRARGCSRSACNLIPDGCSKRSPHAPSADPRLRDRGAAWVSRLRDAASLGRLPTSRPQRAPGRCCCSATRCSPRPRRRIAAGVGVPSACTPRSSTGRRPVPGCSIPGSWTG